jgi:transmembrane sensor
VRYSSGAKRQEVALSDGSRVLLDARSTIAFRRAAGRRDVTLIEGQAYFQVAHNAVGPFVVTARSHSVTATGTAFSVSLMKQKLVVVLERGAVVVASGPSDQRQALLPGQSYTQVGGSAGKIAQVDVDEMLAWRNGYIALHNVTVAEAVEQMNRYAQSPVLIGDAQAGALRVTGRFRTDDPVRFVDTLAELYPVQVRRTSHGAIEIVSSQAHRAK